MKATSLFMHDPRVGNDVEIDDGFQVVYEGSHPEYGDVELELHFQQDGIVFSLRNEDREEIESGWMDLADIADILD